MIERIVSGGQTGADIGGVKTAKRFGIPTGGWLPKGWITQDGPRPEYAELYGMREHASPKYPPRTFLNVKDSDGTMRFAADFGSPGELCTLKAIKQYNRPYFDVNISQLSTNSLLDALVWIEANDIKVLNVAGNAEKTFRGCELRTSAYLSRLLERLGFKEITGN